MLDENDHWGMTLEESRVFDWIIPDRLMDVVLAHVHGCVIDIGIGVSSLVLLKHSTKFNREHFSIDRKEKTCEWLRGTEESKENPNHEVLCCTSHEFIERHGEIMQGVLAVALLDGSHSFDTMWTELMFCMEKLSYGGVVFIHDTMPWEKTFEKKANAGRTVDSWRVREELRKIPEFEAFTWPYTASFCGLTMVTRLDQTRPFYRR
jgi:hypothetical protein